MYVSFHCFQSADMQEKLIEQVKNHEFLYNLSSENYKNIRLRNDTWAAIAEELNIENGKIMILFKFNLIAKLNMNNNQELVQYGSNLLELLTFPYVSYYSILFYHIINVTKLWSKLNLSFE